MVGKGTRLRPNGKEESRPFGAAFNLLKTGILLIQGLVRFRRVLITRLKVHFLGRKSKLVLPVVVCYWIGTTLTLMLLTSVVSWSWLPLVVALMIMKCFLSLLVAVTPM